MGTFIYFTEEQKRRANEVDLEEFLRCRGEKLISSGRDKRLTSDKSITIRGAEWFDHADRKGGRAIDFVQKHYGLSFPEAVTMLLGGEQGQAYPAAQEKQPEPPKPFVLPPANKDMRRVYAYLMKCRELTGRSSPTLPEQGRSMRTLITTMPCSPGRMNTAFFVMRIREAPTVWARHSA